MPCAHRATLKRTLPNSSWRISKPPSGTSDHACYSTRRRAARCALEFRSVVQAVVVHLACIDGLAGVWLDLCREVGGNELRPLGKAAVERAGAADQAFARFGELA